MKKIIYFAALVVHICFIADLRAQKHDYNWMMGYENGGTNFEFGGMRLDFNFKPPKVISVNMGGGYTFTNASACCSDSTGSLLYYSNGMSIKNKINQIMENGDTINPGEIWKRARMSNSGYFGLSPFSLPQPGHPNIYYLFHQGTEFTLARDNVYWKYLYYTKIDMNANGGLGKVIVKNQVLMDSSLIVASATKHANGQDWWILCAYTGSTQHYTYLLDTQGIKGPFIQDIGPAFDTIELVGVSLFSPDGQKYVRHNGRREMRLYDFDRCSGSLSNLRFISRPSNRVGVDFLIFSPNSRFLYANRGNPGCVVATTDTEADDLVASFDTLMPWENNYFPADSPFQTNYGIGSLAPDGKIYYPTFSSTKRMNVIHRPNLPGLAADVEEAGLELTRYNNGWAPVFPNYRLGRLLGSPCDTLGFGGDPDGFQNTTYSPKRATNEHIYKSEETKRTFRHTVSDQQDVMYYPSGVAMYQLNKIMPPNEQIPLPPNLIPIRRLLNDKTDTISAPPIKKQ